MTETADRRIVFSAARAKLYVATSGGISTVESRGAIFDRDVQLQRMRQTLKLFPPSTRRTPSLQPKWFKSKFERLVREWKEKAAFLSSPTEMAMIPEYQQIIGMGNRAVPLLLDELRREPDFWFWALRSITGADPVPEEAEGDLELMAEAWLEWGAEKRAVRHENT